MLGTALAQAAPSAQPEVPEAKRLGDFLIRPTQNSLYGPGPHYTIMFRSQEY